VRRLPDVEDAAWALAGSLGDGERVLAVARAQLPVRRSKLLEVCIAWLGWAAETLLGRRPSAERARPLDSLATRVDLVATDRRILLLDAGWDGTAPATCVGEIPRHEISTARLPFVGDGRWRTLRIDRISGRPMQLHVDRETAGGFVAALSHEQGAGPAPEAPLNSATE